MTTTQLTGTALALLLSAVAPGAFAQVASTNPGAVKAGTYKVDPYHTQVVFSISHFGFTDYSGFFSGASGSLKLDPNKISATKLRVTIPVTSIETTVPILTQQLKGTAWFDVAKFPDATFTSTKVTETGTTTALITGSLTLHGITKLETLRAQLVGSGVNPLNKVFTVGFRATGEIERSDFGIRTYLPALGNEVTLSIAGNFELAQ